MGLDRQLRFVDGAPRYAYTVNGAAYPNIKPLVVDEGDMMITLFHITGALLYCDDAGKTIGSTDVFDRIAAARKHYESVGLGADYVRRFIR